MKANLIQGWLAAGIAGICLVAGVSQAFPGYTITPIAPGPLLVLPPLGSDPWSHAMAVNDRGQAVGTAATLGAHAWIDFSAVNAHVVWAAGVEQLHRQDRGRRAILADPDGEEGWAGGWAHKNGVWAVNPDTAWIAADYNAVYRTPDGGTTWDRQDLTGKLPGNFYLLGVSALDRNIAWAVGGIIFPPDHGIILRTTDGGKTWQIRKTPVDVTFRRASFIGSRK